MGHLKPTAPVDARRNNERMQMRSSGISKVKTHVCAALENGSITHNSRKDFETEKLNIEQVKKNAW